MAGQPYLGLEVWMIGASDELDAAAHALASAGLVKESSPRTALKGEDEGRFSVYVRIRMRTGGAPPQNTTVRKNTRRPAARKVNS